MKRQLAVLLVTGLIVCGGTNGRAAEYYFGFVNKTGHDLGPIRVYYGKTAVATTFLVKNGQATDGPETLPMPAEAEIKWTESDKQHAAKVKLEGIVPHGFDGTLYFVINQDGTVDVKPIAAGDTASIVKLTEDFHRGEYRLGIINKTTHDLSNVVANFDGKEVIISREVPRRVKVRYSDPLTLPIPAETTISWNEDGKGHTVKVGLASEAPTGYERGTIYFVIRDGDTLAVKAIKWSDDAASIELVKEK